MTCCLLLVLHLGGCVTWRSVPPDDRTRLYGRWANRAASGDPRQETVRVTRRNGAVVVFENPTLRGDSIVDGSRSVAVDDVERIEDRGVSAGATLAVVGVAVGVLAVYYIAAVQSCLSDRTRDC
jgi:hypothetical protein